jgi:hypothetical protein
MRGIFPLNLTIYRISMDYIDNYKKLRGTPKAQPAFEELAKQSTVLFAKARAAGLIQKQNKIHNGTAVLPSNGEDINRLLASARG